MAEIPHDALHHLFREDPTLFTRTMSRTLGVEFPRVKTIAYLDTDLTEIKNIERQADTVLWAETDQGPHIVIIEPQTGTDEQKRRSWIWYIAYLLNRYRAQVTLLVLTPKEATARWARKPIAIGLPDNPTLLLRPFVIGPSDVEPLHDVETAKADIVYAVLAALARRLESDIEKSLSVLAEALDSFDTETAQFWAEYTEAGLGKGCTREFWRNIMTTMPYKYPSQMRLMAHEAGREEGLEEGLLKGEMNALFVVLDGRGIELSARDRERIETCTDAELLRTWLSRAATAADAEELFTPA